MNKKERYDNMKINKNEPIKYLDQENNRIYETHKNKKDIDKIYDLVNNYCKENGIKI